MKRRSDKVGPFIEKHADDVKLHGFFYRDPYTREFSVSVLAEAPGRALACEEFRADTAAELVALAAESNCNIGTERAVTASCETSPRWLQRDLRRDRAAHPPGEGGR